VSVEQEPVHVVIVGGGFGGLEAAKSLKDLPVRVTLIDARNHHLFQPLLYQVAMAGLSPADIAIPIRSVLRNLPRVQTLMGTVTDFNLTTKQVILHDGARLHYDYLIVAAGARTNFFGNDGWQDHAFGLKTVEDAIAIRRQVLLRFEEAERIADEEKRRNRLTFIVIGGGPTGVEVAGAMAELGRRVLADDYRNVPEDMTRVVLIEAGPRILNGFHEDLSASATESLEQLGVEVRTDCRVQDIDEKGVVLQEGRLDAGAVVWSAGVEAVPLSKQLGAERDRAGRVLVRQDCSIEGHAEVFVIGDMARFNDANGEPLPGVSPVAMQQARFVAKMIGRRMAHLGTERFEYFDKGMMATIGRSRAVAQSKGLRMTGFTAWLAWLFIHLFYLVGFKNRVFVFLSWIWNYVAYRRGARLITGEVKPEARPPIG